MIKFVKAALVALCLPVLAHAANYKEGVHYDVISDRGSKKPEVTEYFSFFCPACNNMESILPDLKSNLDEGVKFNKVHVDFSGPRKPEVQSLMAQAMAAASILPEKKEVVAGIFAHLHTKRASVNELADIKDIFVAQGVAPEKFDKVFKSFAVRAKTSKMAKSQSNMQSRGALTGVPTFIVNGKYKLNYGGKTGISSPEQMADLINYLAKKN